MLIILTEKNCGATTAIVGQRIDQAPTRVSPELQPTRVATDGEYELARWGVEREGETAEAEDRFGFVGARLFDASSRGPRAPPRIYYPGLTRDNPPQKDALFLRSSDYRLIH